MYRFRPDTTRVDPRYLEAYLQSAVAQAAIDEMKTGGNESGLNLTHDRFRKLPVPVAPLDEQGRIVAEIEKQFSRLDEAVADLKRVKANLKRYKAAVLKAAVEGRLAPTESELARRDGRTYEDASTLLKRIFTAGSGERHGKRKSEAAIEPPMRPNQALPEGWAYVSIERIAELVTDGDHNPPKRTTTGVPHLTAKHVRDWRLVPADCTFISRTDAERVFKRYRPEPGDLIVTCVGTVGRTAIVPTGYEFSPDRNLAAVRPVPGSVSVRFLQAVLESPMYQQIIRSASGSTAQPHLYLGDLRALVIPLPPRDEQLRIVNELELQFSIWVALETQIDSLVQRAQRARQALLARAYAR